MQCSQCKQENPASANFCLNCGVRQTKVCPQCQQALPPEARFCSACGQAFTGQPATVTPAAYTPTHLAERIRAEHAALEARAAADGERKTITALFADLKGSTALIEGQDPEVARAILDPALRIMMDSVHHFEGYVAQALGDGIFALFGAPLAHEDHPQRALLAALRMQEALRRYSDQTRLKYGAPLLMRVGINTGEVVVRSIHKEDLHTDYVPVGHSTHLAARMEQMATPGSILITEHTQKLVEGYFSLKALGAAEIKGVAAPMPVYEVLGVGPLRTRLQVAARRGLTRFVGRQTELAQLKRAAEQAKLGNGQIIGIMGEPGLGKSRLFHEFKLTQGAGFGVFEAYSASHAKASPYLPIIELLKAYFQIQQQDDERTRREKIIGKVLGLDRSLEDTLPYYFALLNIAEEGNALQQMDPQMRRRRTFDAIKRVTLRESLDRPLLLIFEDLHWIDSETQGLLDNLIESIASARILLLTNYRPEYRHDWGAKTYYTQLRLAPFGKAEADEFLFVLLGMTGAPSGRTDLAELRQWILDKTEGTPFFMEEVVQELFEQGVLARDGTGSASVQGRASQIQIPATVQDVLAARIDRLAAHEKALLQQLSVIGREFPLSLARRVVDLPEETLQSGLAALQHKEFLYEQPAFPDVEYIFKHALTQDVAYTSLLLERRKTIHERTARAIEDACGQELDDHLGRLAHHYTRSGNTEKAIEYLHLAGLQTAQRAANVDAVNYLDSALSLLRTVPDSDERDRRELALLLALAGPQRMIKGMAAQEVFETYHQARLLCARLGRPPALFWVLSGLRTFYCVRGDARTALKVSEEILQLAEEVGEPDFFLHAHAQMAVSLYALGNLNDADAHATRAYAYYDFERHRTHTAMYGYDPGVLVLSYLGHVTWMRGYPEQALQRNEASVALARRISHPYLEALALVFTLMHHALRREVGACHASADGLIALAQEHGFPEWWAWGTVYRGWAAALQGQHAGISEIQTGITAAETAFAEVALPLLYALLAEASAKVGNVTDALVAAARGLAYAEKNGERMFEAELHRIQGELTLQADPAAEQDAEACFMRAIKLAQAQQAKSWELRATMSLARLWQRQGKTAEARHALNTVYDWFTEAFETPDLQDAKVLLREWA